MAARDSAYDKILASAAKLFATKGYAGTTTRMIVADAGSSLSAIQTHFGSKEGIYYAVMKNTADIFFELNDSYLREINEIDRQGLLDREMAWNQIVMLLGHTIDWVFDPKYKYEILLVNQALLGLGAENVEIPEEIFKLYQYFERLFRAYTGDDDSDWPVKLAFFTITTVFDAGNYTAILNRMLDKNLETEEGLLAMKLNLKSYTMTNLRVNLDLRCKE
ncbi:MAG: TetR/AcrR family transcriptional regulator [Mogibacterium sp.]|nr:TetR/AcrR family transcriptional regulator [Mogibacterium sp.]